jgi:hypothetical protein
MIVQTKAERRENDALQACHWAMREKQLHAYLDEFAFRYDCRKTIGVGRIASLVIEQLVTRKPLTTHKLINDTRPCRWFASVHLSYRYDSAAPRGVRHQGALGPG